MKDKANTPQSFVKMEEAQTHRPGKSSPTPNLTGCRQSNRGFCIETKVFRSPAANPGEALPAIFKE